MMIRKVFPPGAKIKFECLLCGVMIGTVIGGGVTYFFRFWTVHEKLYDTHAGIRILHPGRMMPTLSNLVSGQLLYLWLLLIGCGVIIIGHYASFYRESRSIYLMKRIPSRAELHVRCLSVPLLTIAIGVLVAYVLFRLYVWCYFRYTPESCIPVQTIPTFWRTLL